MRGLDEYGDVVHDLLEDGELVGDEVHGVFKFLRNCAVKRNNNSAILTFSAKCVRKTSCYISKSAASAKRISF